MKKINFNKKLMIQNKIIHKIMKIVFFLMYYNAHKFNTSKNCLMLAKMRMKWSIELIF